jgi:hypothetical protein
MHSNLGVPGMAYKIGDRVQYEDDSNGLSLQGAIIDIRESDRVRITNYFTVLDSGIYVQFTSDNSRWCKLEDPMLIG